MNKKFLSLAVAAAMAAPMAAQAQDVTLYGKVHASVDFVDSNLATDGDDIATGHHRFSRFGIKGSEDLGNGMKAIFKIENQVGGNVGSRNTYVGLSADWGTILLGQHDTPYKISTGSLDLFGDTAADYNSVMGTFNGVTSFDERAAQTVAYISPNMNGFTVAGAWVEVVHDEDAVAAGSDETGAISLAAMYSNGPFFGTVAYEEFTDGASALGNGQGTNTVAGTAQSESEAWKIGLGYKANGFSVGFMYEEIDADTASNPANNDQENMMINGSYSFGNNVVKAQYTAADTDIANGDYDVWAIGIDHKLSKRTKVYALYTSLDNEAAGMGRLNSGSNAGDDSAYGGATTAGTDSDIFSVGLMTTF